MRGHGRARIGSRAEADFLNMSYFFWEAWWSCPELRTGLHAELYTELHAGNSEKKGHACFQFRTLRGQGPKKWDMPVSSSELYAGFFFLSRHHCPKTAPPVSRLHARGAPVLERLIADGLAGRFPEKVDILNWKETCS